MIIDITQLPPEGADFEGQEPPSVIDLPGEENITIASPVHYVFHAQVNGKELVAKGEVEVDVTFSCSRCTAFFTTGLHEPAFWCVRDLEKAESPQFVDLTAGIRESILLAFPSHPVCKQECKGLCPRCGANWNKERCACKAPTDRRWEALDNLSLQPKE